MSEERLFRELQGFEAISDDKFLLDEGYMETATPSFYYTSESFIYRILKPLTLNGIRYMCGNHICINRTGKVVRMTGL